MLCTFGTVVVSIISGWHNARTVDFGIKLQFGLHTYFKWIHKTMRSTEVEEIQSTPIEPHSRVCYKNNFDQNIYMQSGTNTFPTHCQRTCCWIVDLGTQYF